MYACLSVTCHLHFWQNDRGLLCATAVTGGWNRHRIRVSTQSQLWRRKIYRRSFPGFDLATFRSRVWRSNQQAIIIIITISIIIRFKSLTTAHSAEGLTSGRGPGVVRFLTRFKSVGDTLLPTLLIHTARCNITPHHLTSYHVTSGQ